MKKPKHFDSFLYQHLKRTGYSPNDFSVQLEEKYFFFKIQNHKKSTECGPIYAPLTILKKNKIGIPNSPVNWRDNRPKVDKILLF